MKTLLEQALALQVEALTKERDTALAAAKYAEHIDATPQNQYETMLYDTLKERDAALALAADRLVDAERFNWLVDNPMIDIQYGYDEHGTLRKVSGSINYRGRSKLVTGDSLRAAIDAARTAS